jgi:hypothetical protein
MRRYAKRHAQRPSANGENRQRKTLIIMSATSAIFGDFPVPSPAAANPIDWGGKPQSPPNSSTRPSLKSSSKSEIISGKSWGTVPHHLPLIIFRFGGREVPQ